MKQILKATLLAVALLVGVNANAQMEFGVKAGVNIANFTGDVENYDAKVGFQGGLTLDYGLSETMGVQTGLMFVTKGAQAKAGSVKVTVTPMYLQLPIHFAYKMPLAETMKLVLHAGPYLAYGVGGKNKISGNDDAEDNLESDFFGSKEDGGAKAFDIGLGGGVGMEFGKIGVDLSVDYGLGNLSRADKTTVGNFAAYLSLGYKF